MKSYACAWPFLACLWLAPASAWADAKQDAEKQFRAGVSLQKVEDFEAAISAFDSSLRLYPTKGAWFNLANCLRATHRYPEALTALERLQQDFGSELVDPMRSTVEMQVAELENLTATLAIQVDQPGADIAIDGRSIGKAPLAAPIRLGLGDHEVRVSLEGFETAVVAVNLGPAQAASTKVTLAPPVPVAPALPPALAAAPQAEPPPNVTPPPEPVATDSEPGHLTTVGMITTGAGALLLAGGAATGLWVLSMDNDLSDDCVDGHCPPNRADEIDRFEQLVTTTNVLLAVGAVVSVGGAALWLFGGAADQPSAGLQPSSTTHDVRLSLGPGFVGANVLSKF